MGGRFKCLRCGKCCKDLPLQQHEFDMFRHIMKLERTWDPDKVIYDPVKKYYKILGRCSFLVDSKPHASCRIYSFKPFVCRMFPFSNECGTTHKINETERNDA